MTSFSLVCCLLALSSVAFGQTSYGSYSSSQLPPQNKFMSQTGFEQQNTGFPSSMMSNFQREVPVTQTLPSGYGSYSVEKEPIKPEPPVIPTGYGAQTSLPVASRMMMSSQMLEQPIIRETEADILCRGKLPDSYIPSNDGRGFIVCIAEGKGSEQRCPPGLWFHTETYKCEKKLGPLADPCEALPCLNNGLCSRVGTTYQCQCPAGFDGKNCELDARVCQSQQPCGSSPDVRCQSFRVGAALPYVCIFQNSRAYGPNAQQIQPSPCQTDDKPRPLFYTDKGFIYCDGELMFVESCAGGTVWDESRETCDWPDLRVPVPKVFEQPRSYGYTQQRVLPPQTAYGTQTRMEVQPTEPRRMMPQLEQQTEPRRMMPQFEQQTEPRRMMPQFEQPTVQGYGSSIPIQKPQILPPKVLPPTSRY